MATWRKFEFWIECIFWTQSPYFPNLRSWGRRVILVRAGENGGKTSNGPVLL
jgi:hypothetical protein